MDSAQSLRQRQSVLLYLPCTWPTRVLPQCLSLAAEPSALGGRGLRWVHPETKGPGCCLCGLYGAQGEVAASMKVLSLNGKEVVVSRGMSCHSACLAVLDSSRTCVSPSSVCPQSPGNPGCVCLSCDCVHPPLRLRLASSPVCLVLGGQKAPWKSPLKCHHCVPRRQGLGGRRLRGEGQACRELGDPAHQ